jgi:isopenicillin N synthase-like dioxygenase
VLTVDYTAPDAPELYCKSLKETGFGVLTNHPIPASLIDQTYMQWLEFFNSTKKKDYLFNKQTQDGYFPFKSENAKNAKVSDLKEFYHFYPWGVQPSETRQKSQMMFQTLSQLASELLQWIEETLPESVSDSLSMPLNRMIDNSPNTLLRILHYPPLSHQIDEGAIRAAAHEDINLITLLPAATAPGLEVMGANGQWYKVPCDKGNLIVNVGDMLQMCTREYYKSTTHRVVNPEDADRHQSRYSMPLFLHPRDEVPLSSTHTAVQYRLERLRQIGLY